MRDDPARCFEGADQLVELVIQLGRRRLPHAAFGSSVPTDTTGRIGMIGARSPVFALDHTHGNLAAPNTPRSSLRSRRHATRRTARAGNTPGRRITLPRRRPRNGGRAAITARRCPPTNNWPPRAARARRAAKSTTGAVNQPSSHRWSQRTRNPSGKPPPASAIRVLSATI